MIAETERPLIGADTNEHRATFIMAENAMLKVGEQVYRRLREEEALKSQQEQG